MVIPIIFGVFGIVPLGLEKEKRNWKSQEESGPLFISGRILRSVLKT